MGEVMHRSERRRSIDINATAGAMRYLFTSPFLLWEAQNGTRSNEWIQQMWQPHTIGRVGAKMELQVTTSRCTPRRNLVHKRYWNLRIINKQATYDSCL